MNFKRTLPLIAAGALFGTALAQDRRSFAGEWVRERPAAEADAFREIGSGWGDRIVVRQDATKLTVEYAFFARADMQPVLRFSYALDGSETKNAVMMGREIQRQTSRAQWSGNDLIIVTTYGFVLDGKPMTGDVRQLLSLEAPARLVIETTRSGVMGGEATVNRSVYRRADAGGA